MRDYRIWCTFAGMPASVSLATKTSDHVTCPSCSRRLRMRRNVYGTALGIAPHKRPTDQPIRLDHYRKRI